MVSGRYYAMDRDKRWERTELAYRALAEGEAAHRAATAADAVRDAYARGETDEFIVPRSSAARARCATATRWSSSTFAPTGRVR